VVYWGADSAKDLLVGQADGHIRLYTNIGTDADPTFDGGVLLQVGPPGGKVDIYVGKRTTLAITDWNNDARKDLVVGMHSGYVYLFLNEGTDTAPDFQLRRAIQDGDEDLRAPSTRSAPTVVDLDEDGRKDLVVGNTNGEVVLYRNIGTDAAPQFSGYEYIHSNGVPIDLEFTPRSRPNMCDWDEDGRLDMLLGSRSGFVNLYHGLQPIAIACGGDGSFGACPCGNESPAGSDEGCLNSTGGGGRLDASGSTSVVYDDLTLIASQLPPGTAGFFLQGPALASTPFGDGILCFAPASARRLMSVTAGSGGEALSQGSIATEGQVGAGRTFYYQLWYRDGSGPCGQASNVTSALQVPWSP
jgi:hypothetical protein